MLTWSDDALVVGHQVDPIDRAEQIFIEHLLVLPGMKGQGDEVVLASSSVLWPARGAGKWQQSGA